MAMHFRLQSHAFFLLVFLAFYASSCEQEDYWRMKLPKVPMPQAIKENLLHANAMEPFTIDTTEKMANFDKPYTAYATTGKDKTVASENQPYTVFSWHYNPDTAKAVEPLSDTTTTNAVTTKKDKTAASENQPYTVFSWHYNPDTAKAVEPISDAANTNIVTTKKDKTTTSENQPYTVFSWHYNADTAKAVEPVSDTVTIKKDKTVASENQPYTVFSWHYNPNTAKAIEPISDTTTTNAVTTKKDKTAASENQPYTVFSWHYNPDTVKAVEPISDATNTNIVTIKKDKTTTSENQPYTVFSWHYNPDTAKAVEPISDAANTNIVTTKKDKTTTSKNQPYTVFSWHYNPETVKEVEPFSAAATTKKDKTAANENQPYTVFSWHYNPDNINEKKSIEASHNHHHFTHNPNSKDSKMKEEEDLSGGSVFFVEESLRLGMKLKHDFQKTKKLPFLPKKIAQSIPFSVDKVAEILNLFSIKSESAEATAIKETLGVCLQRPKVKKENRTCAQSMEDIVDFVVKELGTNDVQLRMMRNNIEVPHGIQDYVVTKVKKLVVPGNTAAACHRMVYPYVVYYCHHQQDIGHYDITLVSPTFGNAIQTTAVCHYDTYAWQPDVLALRYLGIRPGDAPVCHFSAINDMFWSIKPNSKYISRHGSVKRVIES